MIDSHINVHQTSVYIIITTTTPTGSIALVCSLQENPHTGGDLAVAASVPQNDEAREEGPENIQRHTKRQR